jgi:hypothetical protein
MRHFIIACLAGASLMACTPASEPAPETPVTPAASTPETPPAAPPAGVDPAAPQTDACKAASYAALIGKPITEPGVPAEGPDVRYLRPNSQMTMDFRPDRLNIEIDANDVITGFRCT